LHGVDVKQCFIFGKSLRQERSTLIFAALGSVDADATVEAIRNVAIEDRAALPTSRTPFSGEHILTLTMKTS